MSVDLKHPGAQPRCTSCHGAGIQVVRDGALAKAVRCHCVTTCPSCQGTGLVAVGSEFRAPRRRCDCVRVEGRMRLFDAAEIPGRYHEATLGSFDPRRGSSPAFVASNAYLHSFRPRQENRGLVLHGGVGRGKTHLMIGVLRELILRHGVSARFIEFTHLLADLKSTFDRRSGSAELLEPLSQVDVLAIDELGKGRNTEFEGTVLDELISRRYNASSTVLATTNYEPSAATHRAAANLADGEEAQPALIDRVGDRVFSRLREMCDFVPVRGDDYREVGRTTRPRPRTS